MTGPVTIAAIEREARRAYGDDFVEVVAHNGMGNSVSIKLRYGLSVEFNGRGKGSARGHALRELMRLR